MKLIPRSKIFYFPLTPRLQRLYASKATARHMCWHRDHTSPIGVMQHPSDLMAWTHFDEVNAGFSAEIRNIRVSCDDINIFNVCL